MRILPILCLAACAPGSIDLPAAPGERARAVDSGRFVDKVTAGYQGWFGARGDGSPTDEWIHWSRGGAPAPGSVTFELYPDVRDYDARDLHDTALGRLGDGREARLFSSHTPRIIDTHFRWMEDSGIDGVGLQRFLVALRDPRHRAFRDDVTRAVREAAERRGRIFYIMYDISGANADTWAEDLKRDWAEVMRAQMHIDDSPQYAHEGGRPVVNVWGLGFDDRPGTAAQAIDLIDWLHGAGCYVVGGVPYRFRTGDGDSKAGWGEVYARLDMVQPWSVGRYATDADLAAHYQDSILADKAWTDARGIAYQRVIFPGFAWSNWNGGPKNAIPRRAGRFFWRQAYDVRRAGASAYVAMFDEYDEGTAIAKAAEDARSIPEAQYFLTLDADGTRVSSDFYLRLAGAATRMLRGEAPHVIEVPISAFPSGGGDPGPGPGPDPGPGPTPGDAVPAQRSAGAGTVEAFAGARADRAVERLYRAILGRDADDSGRGAYVPLAASGRLLEVVSALITSPEFDARRPQLTATGLGEDFYREILDRKSDPGGLAATAGAIRSGDGGARAIGMLLSPEYRSNNP